MSLLKPIITLLLNPKYPFYEFTNSFHAKYKPLSSKCWLGETDGQSDDYASPFGEHKNSLLLKIQHCYLNAVKFD